MVTLRRFQSGEVVDVSNVIHMTLTVSNKTDEALEFIEGMISGVSQ